MWASENYALAQKLRQNVNRKSSAYERSDWVKASFMHGSSSNEKIESTVIWFTQQNKFVIMKTINKMEAGGALKHLSAPPRSQTEPEAKFPVKWSKPTNIDCTLKMEDTPRVEQQVRKYKNSIYTEKWSKTGFSSQAWWTRMLKATSDLRPLIWN